MASVMIRSSAQRGPNETEIPCLRCAPLRSLFVYLIELAPLTVPSALKRAFSPMMQRRNCVPSL